VDLYISCRTHLPDKDFIFIIRLGTHARAQSNWGVFEAWWRND